MDVKDALAEKHQVEQRVTRLVLDFEEKTGLYVRGINLNCIAVSWKGERLGLNVSMDVELR
jgi:hypothetical protein